MPLQVPLQVDQVGPQLVHNLVLDEVQERVRGPAPRCHERLQQLLQALRRGACAGQKGSAGRSRSRRPRGVEGAGAEEEAGEGRGERGRVERGHEDEELDPGSQARTRTATVWAFRPRRGSACRR